MHVHGRPGFHCLALVHLQPDSKSWRCTWSRLGIWGASAICTRSAACICLPFLADTARILRVGRCLTYISSAAASKSIILIMHASPLAVSRYGLVAAQTSCKHLDGREDAAAKALGHICWFLCLKAVFRRNVMKAQMAVSLQAVHG